MLHLISHFLLILVVRIPADPSQLPAILITQRSIKVLAVLSDDLFGSHALLGYQLSSSLYTNVPGTSLFHGASICNGSAFGFPAPISRALMQIFCEKISGKDTNRLELQRMLDFVREGDTVVIESISRLARSTKDFLVILDQLEHKNVALISLKENLDTSTPTGRFMVSIFAALAQLEREQILTRQKDGIEAQKANGTYSGGRPRVAVDEKKLTAVCKRWRDGEITAVAATAC